jgi:hypothetical protein
LDYSSSDGVFTTLWGLSRVCQEDLPSGALWEYSLITPSIDRSRSKNESLFAGFQFLRSGDPSELWEQQSVLIDTCRLRQSIACVVHSPVGWLARNASDLAIETLIKRWGLDGPCPLFFDFGKKEPPIFINPEMIVTDPFWHGKKIYGRYWRIHGWNAERWVRMYSESELSLLIKKVQKHRPLAVIFCHSQRLAQWNQVEKLRDDFSQSVILKMGCKRS